MDRGGLQLKQLRFMYYRPRARLPGDYTEGETPDPIPNSEVKPLRADGSDLARDRESRSSPGFIFWVSEEVGRRSGFGAINAVGGVMAAK